MKLPSQRPSIHCRTFTSPLVEKVILDITGRMVDKDMAKLFENAFPNTLDTTVRWHTDGTKQHTELKARGNSKDAGKWEGAQSFVVTGDINAEWLRDSTNQLLQYQPLARSDPKIFNLILGAINTQAEYVIQSPYCNAFQPPAPSKLAPSQNGQDDNVHPTYEPSIVFECKYELDSLAHFLAIGNTFHNHTKTLDFLTPRWYKALDTVLEVLDQQSQPTFDSDSRFQRNTYTFSRQTSQGTETLPLSGVGNPLNYGTGLIRSAFRPSDDATILGFYIPANAMMAVELKRTAEILHLAKNPSMAQNLERRAQSITDAVWKYGVVNRGDKLERVFAYEVDGYGGQIMMDDANVPSLLALPFLGFVDKSHPVYQSTRKMLLSKGGNPYYLEGKAFHGIGGSYCALVNGTWN
jgi:meiotically up-regulated gene 157 (Mug157) protein